MLPNNIGTGYCVAAVAAVSWFVVPCLLRLTVMRPRRCTSKKRLDGKIALITGANTGLGKVTAGDLASRGAFVYMACRNMEKGEKARQAILKENPSAKLKLIKIDLSSLRSVKECAEAFMAEHDSLDILMANAGFGSFFDSQLTEDGVEFHMGCNHLGHFYLSRLLLPCLEEAGTPDCKARIVVVSSVAHSMGSSKIEYDKLQKGEMKAQAYSQSKLANVLFAKHLDGLLAGRNVTVNSLHPGIVNTEFTRHVYSNTTRLLLLPFIFPTIAFTLNSVEGSQTQIWAAVGEDLEGVSGKYLKNVAIGMASEGGRDAAEAEKLWKWSCEKTGLPVEL